jgi:hypothetical protein
MRIATADQLRDLVVTLKKIGITPAQCALGYRVAMIMINLGVKEDNIELFILDIYNRCKVRCSEVKRYCSIKSTIQKSIEEAVN